MPVGAAQVPVVGTPVEAAWVEDLVAAEKVEWREVARVVGMAEDTVVCTEVVGTVAGTLAMAWQEEKVGVQECWAPSQPGERQAAAAKVSG